AVGTEGNAANRQAVPCRQDEGLLVEPALQEVPFPTAQLGLAQLEQFLSAAGVVGRYLALRQGDTAEVSRVALAVEGLLQPPVGPPDQPGTDPELDRQDDQRSRHDRD